MAPVDPIKDMQRLGISRRSRIPMLTLRTHSILDYVMAVAIALCPYIFGFAEIPAARYLFLVCGGMVVLYSLWTEYPFSFWNGLPFGLHRAFDLVVGAFLMVGYSIFEYGHLLAPGQFLVHYIAGAFIIASGVFTRTLAPSEVVPDQGQDRPAA